MVETDKSVYQKESAAGMFFNSCLGRIVILVVVLCFIGLIAHLTVPSDQDMKKETLNAVRQCINDSKGSASDKSDDIVRNVTAIFSEADTMKCREVMADFYKYNDIVIYRHTFFSTAWIHNNFRAVGARASVGVFGLVIPVVNYNDFVLNMGRIRKDFNQRIIRNVYGTDGNLGSNPDLGNSYDTYQGGASATDN